MLARSLHFSAAVLQCLVPTGQLDTTEIQSLADMFALEFSATRPWPNSKRRRSQSALAEQADREKGPVTVARAVKLHE